MSKCSKFCTGIEIPKFSTDFHSKMSVCRHELEGVQSCMKETKTLTDKDSIKLLEKQRTSAGRASE